MNLKSSNWLSWIILFLMIIFTVRDIVTININPYLITLLLCGISFCLSYKDLVAFSCFLLPLSCGIQSFIWVFIIGCLLIRARRISLETVLLFLLFVSLELFDQARALIVSNEIKNTIFYLVSLFLVLFLVNNDKTRELDYSKNIRYFLYGTSFLLVVLFSRIIIQHGILEVLSGAIRYQLEDTSTSGDYVFYTNANNLGLYATVCISTLLFLGKDNLRLSNIMYIILLIVTVAGGMLTFSRTWFILTCLALLIYIFLANKNKTFAIVLFTLLIFITLACTTDYFKMIVDLFQERLTADDVRDGAGRMDLFSLYNSFFIQNPQYWLTGTGAVNYQSICQQPLSMHNMIQQTYVCYGFLGCAGVFLLFYSIFRNNKSVRSIMFYGPIVFYLIFVQTVQFFSPIFCMYPLVLCVNCLKVNKN